MQHLTDAWGGLLLLLEDGSPLHRRLLELEGDSRWSGVPAVLDVLLAAGSVLPVAVAYRWPVLAWRLAFLMLFAGVIIAESALSFLGIGTPPPTPSSTCAGSTGCCSTGWSGRGRWSRPSRRRWRRDRWGSH